MDKLRTSPADAISDLPDGASIAVSGFGPSAGAPFSLLAALDERGSKGEVTAEMVPQGTLVERLRAAGAGLAAVYTPTGLNTAIADGKEVRYFDGKPYLLETAPSVDYAFIAGHRADRLGNVEFRGANQHFGPSFAKAARVAIVEVDEVVEPGEIPAERIGLPGIFVSRAVRKTVARWPNWRRRCCPRARTSTSASAYRATCPRTRRPAAHPARRERDPRLRRDRGRRPGVPGRLQRERVLRHPEPGRLLLRQRDRPKVVRRCGYALTGKACVDILVTDLAQFRRKDGFLAVERVAPGFTEEEVLALTGIGW